MKINTIYNFNDFCKAMKHIGFCMAGNDDRVFNLTNYYSDSIKNHTGNIETDPWEWRIRSVTEVDFLIYGKLFYNKSGWISKEWIPKFLAIRRQGRTFDEMYRDGLISQMEKKIYDCIRNHGTINTHDLKISIGCKKSDNYRYNTALTNLQMKMLITLYNETNKVSAHGQTYGWPVRVYSTLEKKIGEDIVSESYKIEIEDAFNAIYKHLLLLNTNTDMKQIKKFVTG